MTPGRWDWPGIRCQEPRACSVVPLSHQISLTKSKFRDKVNVFKTALMERQVPSAPALVTGSLPPARRSSSQGAAPVPCTCQVLLKPACSALLLHSSSTPDARCSAPSRALSRRPHPLTLYVPPLWREAKSSPGPTLGLLLGLFLDSLWVPLPGLSPQVLSCMPWVGHLLTPSGRLQSHLE